MNSLTISLTDDTIDKLAEAINKKDKENKRVYNQKEVCDILGISDRTFRRHDVPYSTLTKKGRKLYSLPDVKEYFKR